MTQIKLGIENISRSGKKKALTYRACLGTCLGVALYDSVAGVGGIFHILLPSPPSDIPPENPEKYASTGLPLFLNEMTALGADRDNLTATLAGGALVGPVSQQDINLNIGGRSTEIALEFLKKEGIRILTTETGGFFTCTLELDMAEGNAAIKPAGNQIPRDEVDFSPPSRQDILNTIQQLQPIPQTALKILRMVQDRQCDITEISRELAKDQVLGALTLKICNSAIFAGRVKIETLNDAVLLLGEGLLIKSVITAAVKSYFNQTGATGYSLCRGGLFFHAVGVAMTAEKIALMTQKADPKTAYTAGLLQDIGKVVLDQYMAGACPLFFRGMHQDRESSLDVEKKILGTTHCKAGAFLAREWQFSRALMEVIYLHHQPEKAVNNRKLVSIVYLADLLISRFNTGMELEMITTDHLKTALDFLDLKLQNLVEIIDAIPLTAFKPEEIL